MYCMNIQTPTTQKGKFSNHHTTSQSKSRKGTQFPNPRNKSIYRTIPIKQKLNQTIKTVMTKNKIQLQLIKE